MPPDFDSLDFSSDIQKKLKDYLELLHKWQRSINLVAPSTLSDAWQRHIIDSTQAANCVSRETQFLLDIGTGAGFPGMVIAILRPEIQVRVIDTDQRKLEFVRAVSRETCTPVKIECARFEDIPTGTETILTTRAVTNIRKTLALTKSWWTSSPRELLLMKGESYLSEIQDAKNIYTFNLKRFSSATAKQSQILSLTEIQEKN